MPRKLHGVKSANEPQSSGTAGAVLGPDDHWDQLSMGSRSWNDWRNGRPGLHPNLSGRDFQTIGSNTDDPWDYWLESVNFKDTELIEATLEDGNFAGATFESADLTRASMRRSGFEDVDFRHSVLISASLRGSLLRGADLSDATMGDTEILRIDLSEVKGLSKVTHRFPSIVDVSTLEKTRIGLGRYPFRRLEVEEFLIDCGVPRDFVALLGS